MLQNAYFLAKIGADTAENEQHFAEILPIGRRVADRCSPRERAVGAAREERPRVEAEVHPLDRLAPTEESSWIRSEFVKNNKKLQFLLQICCNFTDIADFETDTVCYC